MSRRTKELPDGTFDEIIDNKDQCRSLINDMCCEIRCDQCLDYPDPQEYCTKCRYFTPEEI